LTGLVAGLKPADRAIFEDLADNEAFRKSMELIYLKWKHDYTEEKLRWIRIIRTNGINTDEAEGRSAVFPTLSRLNHSCAPSAVRSMLEDGEAVVVVAARDIQRGEEITIKYCEQEVATLGRAERRARLAASFAFQCSCEVCDLQGEQLQHNEDVRAALAAARAELAACPADPNSPDLLEMQARLEREVVRLVGLLHSQLQAELPDHLMALHHVTRLLQRHGRLVQEEPAALRQEALRLATKLGPKFLEQFQYWDKLTEQTLSAFQPGKRRKKKK